MDSLVNYGSDDDYEESPRPPKSASAGDGGSRAPNASHADNYEEVQMDLSEDSDQSPKNDERRRKERSTSRERQKQRGYNRDYSKNRDRMRKRDREDNKNSRDDNRNNRDSPSQRYNGKEEDRGRRDDDKYRRDDDNEQRRGDEDRYRNRDRYRDDKYKSSRDKYNDRRRRSSSRERKGRRSRSRSRSGSRERNKSSYRGRYNRVSSKMAHLEKLGIELKASNNHYGNEPDRAFDDNKAGGQDKGRFFMPGITGRFREQIERRKLLWQKKEPEKIETVTTTATNSLAGTSSRAGKVWEATTFAQDSDGKVANKFKRLMGIKEQGSEDAVPPSDIIKKQEEMFSSMEAQYEVARTATHTMRGVGLGFGSFQR